VYGLWNLRFRLQLRTLLFKFPLRTFSRLDEKDVHLIGQHCPIHPLKVIKLHAAEHVLHSSSVIKKFHLSRYEDR